MTDKDNSSSSCKNEVKNSEEGLFVMDPVNIGSIPSVLILSVIIIRRYRILVMESYGCLKDSVRGYIRGSTTDYILVHALIGHLFKVEEGLSEPNVVINKRLYM